MCLNEFTLLIQRAIKFVSATEKGVQMKGMNPNAEIDVIIHFNANYVFLYINEILMVRIICTPIYILPYIN